MVWVGCVFIFKQWKRLGEYRFNNDYVSALAISGSNIFAGTWIDGVYLSSNNGSSWVNTGLTDENTVFALAISGSNIFAGTYG